jgi:hypothetical protein
MYVEITNDKMYPISIEDGWDGKVYIHLWDIENEKKWECFIHDLNSVRKEFLLKRERR